MTGRRAVVGLCMLCALLFSAFAAQNAAAKGTTAFTCKKKAVEGGAGFSGEHCRPGDAVSEKAKYEHVEIPNGVATELTGSNAKTGNETTTTTLGILKSTIAGLEFEKQCTTISGTGTMTNSEVGGEMIASGTGVLVFSGCVVVKPAGQECKLKGGKFETKKIKITTAGQTEPMFAKIEPNEGTTFATVTLEGCKTAALNHEYAINGSIKARPDGATANFTLADTTEQSTLTLGGQKAGIAGSGTLSAKAGEVLTPLSLTTK